MRMQITLLDSHALVAGCSDGRTHWIDSVVGGDILRLQKKCRSKSETLSRMRLELWEKDEALSIYEKIFRDQKLIIRQLQDRLGRTKL